MTVKGTPNYVIYVTVVLGSGSTGTVYFARHKRRGDPCAAKIFTAAESASRVRVKQNEIDFMRMLNHTNIVRFYAIEEESRTKDTVLLMELCTEGSLQKMLSDPEHVSGLRETLFISFFTQFVQGLSYLTLHGVVHRDVKPGNILCSRSDDGRLIFKLTDFGATREMSVGAGGSSQTLYGTEEYLYPETYRCVLIDKVALPAGIENQAEMWSIGVTLFHVATGQLPFQPFGGRNNRATMYEIISTKPRGVISGIQSQSGGPIAWSKDFPDNCTLSRGARNYLLSIISDAVETDASVQCKFDEFFPRCERFSQQCRCVVLFSLLDAHCYHLYLHQQATLIDLKREISSQTDIAQSDLLLLGHRGRPLHCHETETVAKVFPATSEEFPLVISSVSMAAWRSVTHIKPALPRKPGVSGAASSLAGDVTWSRDVTAYCYSVVLLIMSLCRAQSIFNTAQHWLIESLSERVKSLKTSVVDVRVTATSTISNLHTALKHFEHWITSVAAADETLLRLLQETGVKRLSDEIDSTKTDMLKRESRLKIPPVPHITSDGPDSQCQQRRCVHRQEERYAKSRADYVQFGEDKKRQQLTYNEEQIHKYRRMKLGELLESVSDDVTQHCLHITNDQHQQLTRWHCDEFIKASNDVTALDTALQKLRGLLDEAFVKLRQVNIILKEKPDESSKSPSSSSARASVISALKTLSSSSPSSSSSSASVSVPAVTQTSQKLRDSASSAAAAAATAASDTEAVSSSSSSELCVKRVVSSTSSATLRQILDAQVEGVELAESVRQHLMVNNHHRLD